MFYRILFLTLLFVLQGCTVNQLSQKVQDPKAAIVAFQERLNEEYKDPKKSPLGEDAATFKGHQFFDIDLNYRVEAKFTAIESGEVFEMPTTTERRPKYRKYGLLTFKLEGRNHQLMLYQNLALRRNPAYRDYLFLPFKDLTNGSETYGGGRYIDFRIPQSSKVIVDFNQAYNPYCAYSSGFSCPIVPEENHLNIEVKAGILHQK